MCYGEDYGKLQLTEEDEAKATEAAQIVAETAQESTNDDETTKHTANEENDNERKRQ